MRSREEEVLNEECSLFLFLYVSLVLCIPYSYFIVETRGVYFTEYTDRTPPTRALRRPLYVISSLAPALLINPNTQAHQVTRLPGYPAVSFCAP